MASSAQRRQVAGLRARDPATVGPYVLTGVLGSGGMGTVYLARAADGREVALKIVHEHFASHPEFQARFTREVENARRVRSPYTPAVLDAVDGGATPYLVTEFVAGPTLSEYVFEEGPLSASALAQLGLNTLSAIASFHQAGIIHRDLKPHNIVLGPTGPQIIDFGISRAMGDLTPITRDGFAPGTPEFMAPEQWAGREATPATDVFAWACVLVFAGTGKTPFSGDRERLRRAIRYGSPSTSGLDPRFTDVVLDALAKHPAIRPDTAELSERLARCYLATTGYEYGGGPQDRAHSRISPTFVPTFAAANGEVSPDPASPTGSPRPRQRSQRLPVSLRGGLSRRRIVFMGGVALLAGASVFGAQAAGGLFGDADESPTTAPSRPGDPALADSVAQRADTVRQSQPGLAAKLDAAAYRLGDTPNTRANILRHSLLERIQPLVGELQTILFHPSVDLLAMAGGSGTIRLRDVGGGGEFELAGHDGPVLRLAFDSTGDRLVSGGQDRFARIWDLESRTLVREIPFDENPFRVVYSPDDRTIAVAVNNGQIHFIAADSGLPARPYLVNDTRKVSPSWIWGIAFHSSGQFLATAGDGLEDEHLRIWNLNEAGATSVSLKTGFGPPGDIAFNPAFPDDLVVVDSKIRIFDVRRPDMIPRFYGSGSERQLARIVFAPDGKLFAVCGEDDFARVWEAGQPMVPAVLAGHVGRVFDVAFNASGKVLATGGADSTVRLWSTDPAEVAARLCDDRTYHLTDDEWALYVPEIAPFEAC